MPTVLAPPPDGPVTAGPRPTVSVVIAAYQSADTIGETIRSALEQVPPPDEIVVADDGSTDDLAGALAPFGDAVRLVRIEHGGEAAAKNAGIEAATGEWIAILDADDRFLPGRLDALARLAAERPDLDLLTTDAYLELHGEVVGTCYTATHTFPVADQRREMLRRNFVFGQVLVRREAMLALGGYDPAIRYTTDWDAWLRLVLAGGRVGCIAEPLGVYRMHEAAMSASRAAMYEGRVDTLTKTLRRDDLTAEERADIEATIAGEQRRLARERLRTALTTGTSDARAAARAVARDGAQPRGSRLRARAASVAPRLVGLAVQARERRSWVGVGDRRFPRRGESG